MRSSNNFGVCTYGLNNQAGYLFERSQEALRQRSIGRARGLLRTPPKRPRDHDSDSNEEARRHLGSRPQRRVVLDGFKRMRVSPPTESPNSDVDLAIVPATSNKRPLQITAPTAAESWKLMRQQVTRQPMDFPNDGSCRAMVVFDPYQSMAVLSTPRVELVETDTTSSSESDEEGVARFEELPLDNDEPVDMDID